VKFPRAITFGRLEAASFTHSTVYVALLICAFALRNPEPETFVLGMTHGLMWIAMSLICIAAARAHIVPFWVAVTVAVLGGLGPFAGSLAFVIAARQYRRNRSPSTALGTRYS
jgi:ABC-type Fe3+-siderophore transport system permease subunit